MEHLSFANAVKKIRHVSKTALTVGNASADPGVKSVEADQEIHFLAFMVVVGGTAVQIRSDVMKIVAALKPLRRTEVDPERIWSQGSRAAALQGSRVGFKSGITFSFLPKECEKSLNCCGQEFKKYEFVVFTRGNMCQRNMAKPNLRFVLPGYMLEEIGW